MNILETLLLNGISEEYILLILSIPVVATIINFSRYIIGLNFFYSYTILATFLLFQDIAMQAKLQTHFFYGIEFVLSIIVLNYLLFYIFQKIFNQTYIHLLSQRTIAISFGILAILLTIYFGVLLKNPTFIQPTPLILLSSIMIQNTIFNIYRKLTFKDFISKSLGSIFIITSSVLLTNSEEIMIFALSKPLIFILSVVLINILIGKYTGLRISEYIKFYRLLSTDETPPNH